MYTKEPSGLDDALAEGQNKVDSGTQDDNCGLGTGQTLLPSLNLFGNIVWISYLMLICLLLGFGDMRQFWWRGGGTYMHTCMHAFIHTHIHTYVRTYARTHTHTHTYQRMYVRERVCVYACVLSFRCWYYYHWVTTLLRSCSYVAYRFVNARRRHVQVLRQKDIQSGRTIEVVECIGNRRRSRRIGPAAMATHASSQPEYRYGHAHQSPPPDVYTVAGIGRSGPPPVPNHSASVYQVCLPKPPALSDTSAPDGVKEDVSVKSIGSL